MSSTIKARINEIIVSNYISIEFNDSNLTVDAFGYRRASINCDLCVFHAKNKGVWCMPLSLFNRSCVGVKIYGKFLKNEIQKKRDIID